MVDVAKEIAHVLKTYTDEVIEGVEQAKVEVARATVKQLRKTSPKLTGEYSRGWIHRRVGSAQVIHNQTNYQLTHLLEHGHAKVNGGRVEGIPHIRPAEQKAIEEYTKRVEQVIRG